MILQGERILCVTVSDWDDPKRTRHQIMNVLAENNDVIWVEKPISFAAASYTPLSRYVKFLRPLRQVKPGLRILTPPPTVPLLDKSALTGQINGWLLLQWLKMELRKLRFSPTLLWIFSPFAHQLVGKFGEEISIFHCNDTYPDPQYLQKEQRLIRKVDLVIVLSEQLKQEREDYNPNCHVVLHGVDTDNAPNTDPPVPEDLAHLRRPIIGYVGVIRCHVDLELLKYIACSRPEWSIAIVGPIYRPEFPNKEYKKWEQIDLPNFHLLGPKSREEIFSYYRWIDVALYPYAVNVQTRAVQLGSKFFEYLLMGRPIVSTNFATYKGVPPEFYEIASTKEEFLAKIEKCLAEDSPERRAQRQEYARRNSLRARLKEITRLIQQTRRMKRQKTLKKLSDR